MLDYCNVIIISKPIIPDNHYILVASLLKDKQMPMNCKNKNHITNIIVKLYFDNCQYKNRSKNMYKKTDLKTLYGINTLEYLRCLFLTNFLRSSASTDKSAIKNSYNSYLYNYNRIEDILNFLIYNFMAIIITKYEK